MSDIFSFRKMFRKGFALDYIREPDRESVGDDASASRCSTIKSYIKTHKDIPNHIFSDLALCASHVPVSGTPRGEGARRLRGRMKPCG